MGRLIIPSYTVIKDTREREGFGWVFKQQPDTVKSPRCDGTVIEKLDTADYSLKGYEDLVAIERKDSFSELWVNMSTRQTFEHEMERLSQFKYKYVLIESILDKDHFGLSPPQYRTGVPGKALLQWIIGLSIKYGIHVMPVGACGQQICKLIFCEIVRQEKTRWLQTR